MALEEVSFSDDYKNMKRNNEMKKILLIITAIFVMNAFVACSEPKGNISSANTENISDAASETLEHSFVSENTEDSSGTVSVAESEYIDESDVVAAPENVLYYEGLYEIPVWNYPDVSHGSMIDDFDLGHNGLCELILSGEANEEAYYYVGLNFVSENFTDDTEKNSEYINAELKKVDFVEDTKSPLNEKAVETVLSFEGTEEYEQVCYDHVKKLMPNIKFMRYSYEKLLCFRFNAVGYITVEGLQKLTENFGIYVTWLPAPGNEEVWLSPLVYDHDKEINLELENKYNDTNISHEENGAQPAGIPENVEYYNGKQYGISVAYGTIEHEFMDLFEQPLKEDAYYYVGLSLDTSKCEYKPEDMSYGEYLNNKLASVGFIEDSESPFRWEYHNANFLDKDGLLDPDTVIQRLYDYAKLVLKDSDFNAYSYNALTVVIFSEVGYLTPDAMRAIRDEVDIIWLPAPDNSEVWMASLRKLFDKYTILWNEAEDSLYNGAESGSPEGLTEVNSEGLFEAMAETSYGKGYESSNWYCVAFNNYDEEFDLDNYLEIRHFIDYPEYKAELESKGFVYDKVGYVKDIYLNDLLEKNPDVEYTWLPYYAPAPKAVDEANIVWYDSEYVPYSTISDECYSDGLIEQLRLDSSEEKWYCIGFNIQYPKHLSPHFETVDQLKKYLALMGASECKASPSAPAEFDATVLITGSDLLELIREGAFLEYTWLSEYDYK